MALKGRLHPSLLLVFVPIAVTAISVYIIGWRWLKTGPRPLRQDRILVPASGTRLKRSCLGRSQDF